MKDRFSLAGKTVFVTGASGGLGRHFATVAGEAGATVFVGARRRDALDDTVAAVRQTGARVDAALLDVLDAGSVSAAFDEADRSCGPVDVLVNNAGVSRAGFMTQLAEEDWDTVLDTNLKGTWLTAREAAKRMGKTDRGGSIINIASILGIGVAKALGAYAASKGAVIQLTKAMALEWARDGIRVNAIAPGYFPTDMNAGFFETPQGREMIARIPQRRIGGFEDLDGPLLLLASEASRYMTGSVITVDGGHLCQSL